MNREGLDRFCEWGILFCVLAILIAGPLAFGAVDTVPFLSIQILTAVIVLLWIARIGLDPKPRFLWPPICWAAIAFTIYAVLRYFPADIEYVARQELIRVLVYALQFFAILNNLHRQETMKIITFTLIFLAMGISCYAVYQFLVKSAGVWDVPRAYPQRASGTYISPNHLGGFLEMILPLALVYAIAGRIKPVTRILVGYAALVIMTGIAVTVSRGAWIAATLSLLVLFTVLLFHRTHRIPAALSLVILLGAGVYFLPKSYFIKARSRLVQNGRLDDDKRFALWRPALQLWRENFWWGVGPGHFNYRFRQVRPEDVQLQPDRVHNDFLNTLVDWGSVGAALVSGALLLLFWGIVKTWRIVRGTPRDLGENKRSNKFAVLLGAAAGLLAVFFHSVVDFNMHIPANAILAVTLMALISAHLRFATDGFWLSLRPWSKILSVLALTASFCVLSQQAWRRGLENSWLERAGEERNFSTEQVAALERAFAVEPRNGDTAYQIGRDLRRQSQEGGQHYEDGSDKNYEERAREAMSWFERSIKLDPWNAYSYLGYGWCLDWLGRTAEADPYFAKAEELDPNGYFTLAQIGLHFMEAGKFAAARPWFERSLSLERQDNPIAQNYLQIANNRLLQDATNELNLRLSVPVQ